MSLAGAVVDDLYAESEALDALVAPLTPEQWTLVTPAPGWTIAHQIGHLWWTDRVALLSITDEPAFDALVVGAQATVTTFVDDGAAEAAELPPAELLAAWRLTRADLHAALRTVPDGRKLHWFGPPMSGTSMATARLMETWAHGVDVSDTAVPQWPIENHICLMGLTDGQIDACGLLYLALAKFSNVPRVSILKGGFEAVHNDLPQELIDHDPVTCSMCNGLPLSQLADRKPRLRAGSNASSSYADSSVASSPVSASSPSNGSLMQKFKSFVSESSSVVASSTGSFLLNSGSRFLVGSTPPIPASRVWFAPAADQLVQKCRLTEVLGRSPSSDIEAHALLVVGKEGIRCYAAPLDMTVLTANCELRLYGSWRVVDLCKITSKDSQPAALLFYFSVESDPDLVVTMINGDVARSVVDDVRRKYRQAKKGKN